MLLGEGQKFNRKGKGERGRIERGKGIGGREEFRGRRVIRRRKGGV